MKQKSKAQLESQWKRLAPYTKSRGKECFKRHLMNFCRYSNRMTDYLGKCPTYWGRVIDEELYNKPVPKSVYMAK